MEIFSLEFGLKYLGFFLKPTNYHKGEWMWLIQKIEQEINLWCYNWLPLGGE